MLREKSDPDQQIQLLIECFEAIAGAVVVEESICLRYGGGGILSDERFLGFPFKLCF